MKILLVVGATLIATAALAQRGQPAQPAQQATEDKGPEQVKAAAASSKGKSIAEKLQACLTVDDGTKYRLDCFDAVLPPKPMTNPAAQKKVMDCRFLKEQDERLACFNGFTAQIPKFSR
jgi:hypothetical protein